MKISDVINLAIDKNLWEGTKGNREKLQYSCNAVLYSYTLDSEINTESSLKFLEEMGWDSEGRKQFDEFPYGEKRQYARAIALTFAALIAEEEGL